MFENCHCYMPMIDVCTSIVVFSVLSRIQASYNRPTSYQGSNKFDMSGELFLGILLTCKFSGSSSREVERSLPSGSFKNSMVSLRFQNDQKSIAEKIPIQFRRIHKTSLKMKKISF
jgi:hypothetical protein